MIGYPYGSIVTALFLVCAGVFTLARLFLLEPTSKRYPKAPAWLRNIMFAFAAAMIFIGLQYGYVFLSGAPRTSPPQPNAHMQFMATGLFLYSGAMLFNILRQRYPEHVWKKLNRINDHLCCTGGRSGSFWKWLSQ